MALIAAIDHYLNAVKFQVNVAELADAVFKVISGEEPSLPGFALPVGTSVTSFREVGEIGRSRSSGGTVRRARLVIGYLPSWLQGAVQRPPLRRPTAPGPTTKMRSFSIDPHGGGLADAASLHSQALMVINVFSTWQNFTDWHEIGQLLFNAMFDDNIANRPGRRIGRLRSAAAKLMGAVAYSTVTPGTGTVFGDTAVWSMSWMPMRLGKSSKAIPRSFSARP